MKAALLLPLLCLPALCQAQSATPARRLSSQAYFLSSSGSYQLQDSAHYAYSGQRGSRFDVQHLRYTDLQNLGSAPDADFTSQRIPAHNIDSIGLPRADYDTAFFALGIQNPPATSLRGHEGHRYDATGAITAVYSTILDPSGTQLYGQQSISVYSSGRLSRSYISGFDGSAYDTSFIRDYRYDGSGRLTLDSLSIRLSTNNYIGYRKITFAYGSGTGYVTSTLYSFRTGPSRLVPDELDSLSYYPDQKLRTHKYLVMGAGGNFLPEALDSFGYTSGVAGYTYLREQLLDTLGNPDYTYITTADRINARGQKDSMTFSGFRGSTPLGNNRIAIAYDTAGYPVMRSEYFSSTGPTPYAIEYYRYEDIPRLGVAGVPRPTLGLEIYPNPSQGVLQFSLSGTAPGSPIQVSVYNNAGQLVYRRQTTWTGQSQPLILGPEAPAGNYSLQVETPHTGARSSRQFTRL